MWLGIAGASAAIAILSVFITVSEFRELRSRGGKTC
jgi:hypothetical protein